MEPRKSFLLRIDPRLHDEIKAWAEVEMRSVNGQIEFLLREAVARRRKEKRQGEGEAKAAKQEPRREA